jgi:signal transduction histidine kinase
MAVSYVLVTAAAVILVDGVVLGILLPQTLASSSHASRATAVAEQAGSAAKLLTAAAVNMARKAPPGTTGTELLTLLARDASALGLATSGGPVNGSAKACLSARSAEALIQPDGTVIASSDPAACPPGLRLAFAAQPGLASHGGGSTSAGPVVWAVSPIADVPKGLPGSGRSASAGPSASGSPRPGTPSPVSSPQPGTPSPGGSSPAARSSPANAVAVPGQLIGGVYIEGPGAGSAISFAQLKPLLLIGGLALAVVIPVGAVFGLLSTRRMIRRIERLADVTTTVAGGDFRPRVQVSSGDEISQLEDAFNRMASRLSAAVDTERRRASRDARHAERARIARELHDSISQDLFSLSLLAAGLRKALQREPALRPEVEAMERTATKAMREMQALLLELRPVALEDAGLVPALADLCQAYQARLAIRVTAELGEVSLDPVAEHAVLRVIQEALGNAARHGQPETILVRLRQLDGAVTVEVRDDGRGFDPQDIAERHGMGLMLMRERVAELGGDFRLDAAPGWGAAVVVRLPAGQGGRP